jgi:hypothetical protein
MHPTQHLVLIVYYSNNKTALALAGIVDNTSWERGKSLARRGMRPVITSPPLWITCFKME